MKELSDAEIEAATIAADTSTTAITAGMSTALLGSLLGNPLGLLGILDIAYKWMVFEKILIKKKINNRFQKLATYYVHSGRLFAYSIINN